MYSQYKISCTLYVKIMLTTLVINAQLLICLETSRAGRYTTTVNRQIIKHNSK